MTATNDDATSCAVTGRSHIPGTAAIFFLTWLLSAAPFLIADWRHISHDVVTPHSDFAADMLHIDQARHGQLFTGHYSRFGFNHPGPFFLLCRYWAELALEGVLPGPYNAQFVGVLATNTLFIALAACVVFRMAAGGIAAVAASVVGVGMVLSSFCATCISSICVDAWWAPALSVMWTPPMLIAPFLALVVACGATARGDSFALIVGVFAGCALIHGYMSMPFFVLPCWALMIAQHWIVRRRVGQTTARVAYGLSTAIAFVFAVPIAIDVATQWPGNIGAIVAFTRASAALAHPSWSESLTFASSILAQTKWPVWLLGTGGLLVCLWGRAHVTWQYICATALTAAMACSLFIVYIKNSPGELFEYVGYFIMAVPAGLSWVLLAMAFDAQSRRRIAGMFWINDLPGLTME